ncbi:arylesterase [Qipengyuania sp. DGS5-3]|uniref:arylesterase n=1 Tax=Qipengyuania sp. DGS5-3 TaxID=3349632 RepID=UPI0036D3D0F4
MRSLSILFFMGALAGCGGAADPQPKPEEEIRSEPQPVMGPERTIMAFGNSLFAGYGVGEENSYPAQLEAALRAQGINAKMINAGISGDTTAAGLQRLAFTLDAQETKPELLLLELGGNDLLRGLSPDQTRANFVAMLEELKSRKIPVLLMGMRAPPNYGPEFQAEFDALYGELAEEYDVGLVPFWLETIYQRPELFQNDRIHPTTEGLSELVVATKDAVVAALPELPEDAGAEASAE